MPVSYSHHLKLANIFLIRTGFLGTFNPMWCIKYECGSCAASYIGETCRHLCPDLREGPNPHSNIMRVQFIKMRVRSFCEITADLSTRINEHLETYKESAIYKHIHEQSRQGRSCKRSCNSDSFTILDKGATKLQLRMKEGMYIKRDSPVLNTQVKSYSPHIQL